MPGRPIVVFDVVEMVGATSGEPHEKASKGRLGDLDAWHEILDLATSLATRCGDAYAKASDRTRKQFNAAVFERLEVKDGRLSHQEYRPPFDDIFNVSQFEYGIQVEVSGIEPAPAAIRTALIFGVAAGQGLFLGVWR